MTRIKRLHWGDWLILAGIAGVCVFLVLRVQGTLEYKWRWGDIPRYILAYDASTHAWFANMLLQGLLMTLRISIFASVLALILGIVLGLGRTARSLAVRLLARTYLELLRIVPPVVIIFIFYFFLSAPLIDALRIDFWARAIARSDHAAVWTFFFGDMRRFSQLVSGTIVLALFESAFVGEIVRAGIESVGRGQREAANSIGMTHFQSMRFIILPQAMRKIMPPMANQFIMLIKDSSIVSLISVQELTFKTLELVSSTRMIFEGWLTAAAFYFVISFSFSRYFARKERKFRLSP